MTVRETVSLIEHLTQDDDERQELWVHYLENSDAAALCTHLLKIRKTFSEEQLLQVTLWKQANCASEMSLLYLFDNFSDLEQSVMRLLTLGASLTQIAGIKGLHEGCIRHIIAVIREHDCWKELEDGD